MSEQIDLLECEREPLCTLGFIQSHGCLFAFEHNWRISYASANVAEYLEIAPSNVLARDLRQLCSPQDFALLEASLPRLGNGIVKRFRWGLPKREYTAWLHRSQDLYILELQNHDPQQEIRSAEMAAAPRDFLESVQQAASIQLMAQNGVDAFALASGYDRVMIYQFHQDWSGQIIAEHRKPAAEAFFGLRYPATDIPSQARQLYTVNLLRVVVDTHSTPTPILSDPHCAPIDLTYSILRSVSPYHIEYLRNMQVSATLTASLIVDGRLWGMLACHHSTVMPIVPWNLDAAASIAQAMSLKISALQQQNTQRAEAKAVRQLAALESEITTPDKIVEGLCFGPTRIHALLEIDSAAIYTEGGLVSVGNTPTADWIHSFVEALLPLDQDVFSFGDSASGQGWIPCEEAAGALAIVLTRKPAIVILCFRTEFEHDLTWAGDATKTVIRTPNSERLSPRKSFAVYKQTVRGKSLPWTADDLKKALRVLPILRRLLPEDSAAAASIISLAIQKLSDGLPTSSSLFRSLLDLVSEGMSLFIHNQSGSPAPAFASEALLNQFNLDDHGPEFSLSLADFFRHIGLPRDLLDRMHFGPQEVHILTGRSANRSYLAELKKILEVTVGQNRLFLAVLTFHDITKYARLLEATEVARQQADHVSQIKSAFIANMSHEVRTPLNGILGMADMLRGMGLAPEPRKLVEVIERSGKALLHLVNDILDFSKIEAGKLMLESVSFNLQEVLDDAVRLFRPTARPGVELLLEAAANIPALLIGDPGRLRQVLMNLLGNALKFTHEGRVTLQVQGEKASPVNVRLDFRVVDTGIGIAEDKIAALFERFNQAESSTTRKYGGTGLGLSISKQLVTLMGGHIDAASVVGKGTTLSFTLTFLIDSDRAEEPAVDLTATCSLQSLAASCLDGETQSQEKKSQGPVRVLVVDDNLINRKVATALLTREGHQVTTAGNGREAVDFAKNGAYDIILMDCQMPEMDGYQVTALIRENEAGGKRTPIVAVTANGLKEQRDRCLAAGMDDFLTKPINPKALADVVQKWIAVTPRNGV